MADDSWDVQITTDFHPYSRPHGLKDYILNDLTDDQLRKLSEFKRQKIREDQKYLAEHPEVRAITALILRLIMRHRPQCNIHEFIARYFLQSSTDIRDEIEQYIAQREKIISVNSTEQIPDEIMSSASHSLLEESSGTTLENLSIDITDNMDLGREEETEEDLIEMPGEDTLIIIKHERPGKDRGDNEIAQICRQIIEEILDDIYILDAISLKSYDDPDYCYDRPEADDEKNPLESSTDSVIRESHGKRFV